METSADDVHLAARGDVRAFERLYRAHVARIHGLARRIVGNEDADDLTQEVFVKAWDKLDTFRGESAFGTWLYRLGMNLMLTYRASRDRQPTWLAEDEAELPAATAPRESTIDWRSVDLEAALAALPDGARNVFVLHDIEGYRHEEIGDMLDIATGTSKSQLHRARLLLREHLSR